MQVTLCKRVVIVAAGLALCGCAEKLTYQRFEIISEGQSPEAVEATLGKPWMKNDQTWIYWNQGRQIRASIYFDREESNSKQVIAKEWHDPEHGMVGKSPYVTQPGESHELKLQKIR